MAIRTCTCKHPFQDERYGHGKRVHNRFVKNNGGVRCTVCGDEKNLGSDELKAIARAKE